MSTKEHLKHAVHRLEGGTEKVVRPEEARRKRESQLDNNQSARREGEVVREEGLRAGFKRLGVGSWSRT